MKISWHDAMPFSMTWAQAFSGKCDEPVSCTCIHAAMHQALIGKTFEFNNKAFTFE